MHRLNKIRNSIMVKKQIISQTIKPDFKQVYQKYLHSYETRSSQEIKATNEKIFQFTKKNFQRLNSVQQQSLKYPEQKLKNCILICLPGTPPFKNQFQGLNLPKNTYHVLPNGLQFENTEEQLERNLQNCKFGKSAEKIHQILQQNPNKEIIFIYHSAGTYSLSVYFHKYGTERIKGLIQIGAAPIRQYRYITEIVNHILKYSFEDIKQNKNDVAGKKLDETMLRINNELKVKFDLFPSIGIAKSFLHYYKSPEFPIMFDLNRRYPNVLKLMIFGEDDNIFNKDLLCERALFYSKQKINNQDELKKKLNHGFSFENLQQNFIFMIPKGKHSLHMQKKNQPIIKKAVQQYLNFILS